MDYKTVFEISKESYQENNIVLIIIAVICVLIFFIILHFNKKNPTKRDNEFIIGLIGLCSIFLFSVFENKPYLKSKHEFLNKVIENKEFKIVEGVIEQFHPMPYEGHDRESFTVKGIYFEYSDFHIDYGFNNTSSHGGPIKHNGQEVRLSYFSIEGENQIIKIELKK